MFAPTGRSRTPLRWGEPRTTMNCPATGIGTSAFGWPSPATDGPHDADPLGPQRLLDGEPASVLVTLLLGFGAGSFNRIALGSGQQAIDDPRQVITHRLACALWVMLAQRRQDLRSPH